MITIDELRRDAMTVPRFCGTGAIKVKTLHGAYRFYNEKLIPRHNVEIHTHTFTFHSSIIKGILGHKFYDVSEVEEKTEHQLTEGVCKKGCPPEVIAENVCVTETLRVDMAEGSTYTIDSKVYHDVEFMTDSVITLIKPISKGPVPRFIRDKKIGYICPWGDTHITPSETWEIIDCMLND